MRQRVEGRSRARKAALLTLASLLLAVVLLGVLAIRSAEVVEKGPLVPWSEEVFRVQVFDRVTLYADPAPRPTLDLLNSFLLAALAGMAGTAFALVRFRGARPNPRLEAFFLILAGGVAFFAVDEFFSVHETAGHNLRFLREIPGVTHPDDVIFAAYAVPAVVFAYAFREFLLSSRRALGFLAAAFGFYVVAAGFDLADLPHDEFMEPLSAVCAVAGFMILTVDQFSQVEVTHARATGDPDPVDAIVAHPRPMRSVSDSSSGRSR